MKISKTRLAYKALHELGPQKLGLLTLYKLGLKTGYFRWQTPDNQPLTTDHGQSSMVCQPLLDLPDPEVLREIIGPEGLSQLKVEADEIAAGRVRLFGGAPVPLDLQPPGTLSHWTDYARGKSAFPDPPAANFPIPDIKYIWEPARFGWAFTLGRAYHHTKAVRYPEAFWRYFEMFQAGNPVNRGPNWESAQEVALRLIAFTFAAQIFADAADSTAHRTAQLARAIADHAARIPPTLIYARAQNNNHLLSEAAGLITASLALPAHPQAPRWSKLGWRWFTRGLQSQIANDGAYMQQSTNYHRLMLQLALWVYRVRSTKCEVRNTPHPALGKATRWLLKLCDAETGRLPNLGPNDGAYILPLTTQPFSDYRPVLQAAGAAFLGVPACTPGPWDAMKFWLCTDAQDQATSPQATPASPPATRPASPPTLHAPRSWAYLRAAKFHDRPGHADQLHLDLWWRGLNIAQDAGTYLYNAAPPWDNALTHTAVHNTVMVDHRQQMTPAGRFLYLDRAQAEIRSQERAAAGDWERIVASHDGYQKIGIIHQRTVTADQKDQWIVADQLKPAYRTSPPAPCTARLHWLLPDWDWRIDEARLQLEILSPYGWVGVTVNCPQAAPQAAVRDTGAGPQVQLVRAGELLYGTGEISPTWGWISPTYGEKQPALSFSITVVGTPPLNITSEWRFPNE